jgi:AcrR family transcriptional regulator
VATRGRPRTFDRTEALRRSMEVFWARGYGGSSLTDLTGAMGIGSPSLYAAFGSKEALFREALTLYNAEVGAEPERLLHEADTARAGVGAMLHHHARAYVSPGRPSGCMVALAIATAGIDDDLHEFLTGLRRADVAGLQRRIDRGVTDGDVPAGTDTAAVAEYYYAVSLGMALRARDGVPEQTLHAIAAAAVAGWDAVVTSQP